MPAGTWDSKSALKAMNAAEQKLIGTIFFNSPTTKQITWDKVDEDLGVKEGESKIKYNKMIDKLSKKFKTDPEHNDTSTTKKKTKRKAAELESGDGEGGVAKMQRGMGTSSTKQTSGSDVVVVGDDFEDDYKPMPSRFFSGLMPAWKARQYEAILGGYEATMRGERAGDVNKVKEMTDG